MRIGDCSVRVDGALCSNKPLVAVLIITNLVGLTAIALGVAGYAHFGAWSGGALSQMGVISARVTLALGIVCVGTIIYLMKKQLCKEDETTSCADAPAAPAAPAAHPQLQEEEGSFHPIQEHPQLGHVSPTATHGGFLTPHSSPTHSTHNTIPVVQSEHLQPGRVSPTATHSNFLTPRSSPTHSTHNSVPVVQPESDRAITPPPIPSRIFPATLPPNILQILGSQCPFSSRGVTVEQTHVLAWVEKGDTVNQLLQHLANRRPAESSLKCRHLTELVQNAIGNIPVEETHWVLMLKEALPNSRGLSPEERQQLLEQYPDYVYPTLVESILCMDRAYHSEPKELLYSNPISPKELRQNVGGFQILSLFSKPNTGVNDWKAYHIHCQETINHHSAIIGGHTADGFRIDWMSKPSYGYNGIGPFTVLCPARRVSIPASDS